MIPTLVRREIPDPAPCVFLVGVLQYRGVFDRPPHFPYLQKPTTLRLNDEPGFLPVPFLRQKGAHEKWKSTDDGSEKENDEPLSSKTFLLRTLFPTYPLYLPWHPSWKRCSAALALPSAGGCAWDQRRVDWASGPDGWRISDLSACMTLHPHQPTGRRRRSLLRRRRPVWAKCFDQSSVEARPIDQYRPPERTGFEILREIARGTPRFCEIARTNQQIPFWQLGGGPIVFQLLSVISPPHVPRRNGTQKGVPFLRLNKWVERGSDFSVASNCELISGKRWFVVAFSGRTSPLFHFYTLQPPERK